MAEAIRASGQPGQIVAVKRHLWYHTPDAMKDKDKREGKVSAIEIPGLRKIESVTGEVLEEIVRRVVGAVRPDRIILFGSYAHERPHTDSDLDLLIIMSSNQPRWQRAIPIYDALRGLLIPKDVVVYTPQEVEEWSEVPQAFITTAIRKGKVLYEKK